MDATRLDYYIQGLPWDQLRDNPNNPRQSTDPEALQQLADDIAANGLLDALLVVPTEDRTPDDRPIYEVRAGSRRTVAMRDLLGLATCPSVHVVAGRTDEEVYRISLVSNLQRVDLNPMDEARG